MGHLKKLLVMLMALALIISMLPLSALATAEDGPTPFEQQFLQPEGNDAKPFVRWWIAPGRMEEGITRQQVRDFADGGFGGIELVGLGFRHSDVNMNDLVWNEAIYWIFDEAAKAGLYVDVMLTELWPLTAHRIAAEPTDLRYDHPGSSQTLYVAATEPQALKANETFTVEEWPLPVNPEGNQMDDESPLARRFQPNRNFKVVAVLAAMVDAETGEYDPQSVIEITEDVDYVDHIVDYDLIQDYTDGVVNSFVDRENSTGAVTFEAPSDGTWTIFYCYQQATGQVPGYGVDSAVVDHLGVIGSRMITDDFDIGIAAYDEYRMENDPYEEGEPTLTELYQQVGKNFFSDSIELNSGTIWTHGFLEEFEERMGYDLTPYLPAIWGPNYYTNADAVDPLYEYKDIGTRVRLDYGRVVSELFAENNVQYITEWAEENYDMGLRLQAYGTLYFDQTLAETVVSVSETENHGGNMDNYRNVSGGPHLRDGILSVETGWTRNSAWRMSWTGTYNKADEKPDTSSGLLKMTNRLFAAGVNKIGLHGTSAKLTDFEDQPPEIPVKFAYEWAGFSMMSMPPTMAGNEWDTKTPMWEHVNVMTDYLTRASYVLQQGQADMDLAFYKDFLMRPAYTADPYEVNEAGYTFDYVSEALLDLPGAALGEVDGRTVIGADGPSYKALIIDQCRTEDGEEPYVMSLEMAEKVLSYAQAGLPVIIVGEAPNRVAAYAGSADAAALSENDLALQAIIQELLALESVSQIPDRTTLVETLEAHGVYPDARPQEDAPLLFFHRTADEAEFYFVANDTGDELTQTVSFKGEGKPYLLNAWSGEVTPIVEYTAADGYVTLDLSLAGEGQLFLAIAQDGFFSNEAPMQAVSTDADSLLYEDGALYARTSAAGSYTVELSDGETLAFEAEAAEPTQNLGDGHAWDLTITSWQPLDPENPVDLDRIEVEGSDGSTYSTMKFLVIDKVELPTRTITELEPWYAIDESLQKVIGVGKYVTTFEMEKGWSEGQGAILQFERVSDVMKVQINGHEVAPDQIAKSVDIGEYLQAGENELVVHVTTNQANYRFGEGEDTEIYQFGVIGDVLVIPYVQTAC